MAKSAKTVVKQSKIRGSFKKPAMGKVKAHTVYLVDMGDVVAHIADSNITIEED